LFKSRGAWRPPRCSTLRLVRLRPSNASRGGCLPSDPELVFPHAVHRALPPPPPSLLQILTIEGTVASASFSPTDTDDRGNSRLRLPPPPRDSLPSQILTIEGTVASAFRLRLAIRFLHRLRRWVPSDIHVTPNGTGRPDVAVA
jgi:hypothetical protein